MSSPKPERTPWYASIVTRITLAFAMLLLAAIATTGWFSWQASRDELIAQALTGMRHSLTVAATRTQAFENALREDIEFLATNDATAAWCAQADTTDSLARSSAVERLTGLMEPFIRSRAMYAQVRLIAADSLGMEVVRFDREGDHVTHVPDSLLQAKGDRDYYRRTMEMGPGDRYFSVIDLNKEHGHIMHPVMPTLRASAPLFTRRGARAGIIIINTDLRPFFAELSSLADSGLTLMLADANGELILHPDTSRTFRFEFGGSHTLYEELPMLRNSYPDNDTLLEHSHSIPLGPGGDLYTLAITRPMSHVLRELRAKRDDLARLLWLIAGGTVLLSLLFALSLRARLNRLTHRMERYAVGAKEQLPTDRSDEVGRMARGLQHMQERIDARVNELETARAQAEASDRQRRDLLANMSHEVRTPLNAIIGMSSDLDITRLSEGDREKVAIVQRSAQRLKGLVDDLLTHARIGEGRLAVQLTAVDLRTLVQDIVQAHRPMAKAKGLALRSEVAGVPDRVGGDALRLHQILDNLVGNAVRFTSHGAVDITVSVVDNANLRISVADTGPGIPEAERDRVFERFERATTSEQGQGAGLGLAITQRLVELLGGRISLKSEVGNGSLFTVDLPVHPVPVEVAGERRAEGSTRIDDNITAGLRVLYVEDVATNRMLVQEWAQRWQWELTMVENGEAAIDACQRASFDLLLIDLGLGQGMNGNELALRLRGTKRHRYVPMIALTAYAADGDDAESLTVGMNDHVAKPVDREHLLKTAAFWCDRWNGPGDGPDLSDLNAQYDGDREKLLTVYQQYRKEFTQRRLALRAAVETGDAELLRSVRHMLRPHWQLLKMHSAIELLDALDTQTGTAALYALEETFRRCDRALMRAQRALVTAA